MARLRFYPTPADFGIGFGESVPLRDEAGDPIGDLTGRVAAVPEASVSFEVCTSDDYGDLTTDLIVDGEPAETWDTSEDFVTLGRGPILEGPDGHVGPLYLTPDSGATFYRIEPDSTELYARLEAAELALTELELDGLANVNTEGKSTGDSLFWNNSVGEWVVDAPSGIGTVTSVAGVEPDDGDVPDDELKLALNAADATMLANFMTLVRTRSYASCAPLPGGGYQPKPTSWTNAIRYGAEQPTAQLATGDIWLRPKTT